LNKKFEDKKEPLYYKFMIVSETIDKKRKRLIFRSEHRGMKEMDILLGSFARKYVPEFNDRQLNIYEEILQHNDPDLYNWITEKEKPDMAILSDVFDQIKAHTLS